MCTIEVPNAGRHSSARVGDLLNVPTLYGTCPSQVLSSFEVYKKEVLSGSLDWTPMHTSVRPVPPPPPLSP